MIKFVHAEKVRFSHTVIGIPSLCVLALVSHDYTASRDATVNHSYRLRRVRANVNFEAFLT